MSDFNGVSASWLAEYMNDMIARRRSGWSVSTFRNYRSAALAFDNFVSDLQPDAVIDRFLVLEYHSYLVRQNFTEGTVNLYLRLLKSVVMMAEKEGVSGVNTEVFNGFIGNYSLTETLKRHQSLDRQELRRLASMELSADSQLDLVRDLFMFCFYCQGMEVSDAVLLRNSDISGGMITYRKRGNGVLRPVMLDVGAKDIIKKYRNKSSEYVFPIMDMSGDILVSSIRHRLMKDLKRLGQRLSPQISLTFNMARYSWLSLTRQLTVSSLLRS